MTFRAKPLFAKPPVESSVGVMNADDARGKTSSATPVDLVQVAADDLGRGYLYSAQPDHKAVDSENDKLQPTSRQLPMGILTTTYGQSGLDGPHECYWDLVSPEHHSFPACIDESSYLRLHHSIVTMVLQIIDNRDTAMSDVKKISDVVVANWTAMVLPEIVQSMADDEQIHEHFSQFGDDFMTTIIESGSDDWARLIAESLMIPQES